MVDLNKTAYKQQGKAALHIDLSGKMIQHKMSTKCNQQKHQRAVICATRINGRM